ncbi:DC-STAMP domain-containing protein 2 [Aplysia californica]|uniref:DC-STAMP domain-containing protein 2 n=1 Tax=Aplysia californica TaxID=6500 RepID=A0ABM1A4I7_APLCA|nr:DC-STAMP domain-containing protein 2 [Aplysia californica]
MPLTVLLVVVKALLYRRGYLNKDNYDNCYITRYLMEIDAKRTEMEKETVFPLKTREKFKYIKTFSMKMTEKEAQKMVKGVLLWLFAAFHAGYYLLCDYGLYWILTLVRVHMDVRTKMAVPAHLQMHVQGQGPMADMYKAMVGVLEPVADDDLDIDTSQCLPKPSKPNFPVYQTVVGVLAVCFFLTVFEAYGLRLRHAVAACYYPQRERVRAVWLYNHILVTRGSFLSVARRQLHRKRKNEQDVQKISIRSRIVAQCPMCKPVMKCLGHNVKHCLCCGEEGKANDMNKFIHCDHCKTPYCNDCFADLGNICTACMNPVDYGDADDESVETDSSEDEQDKAVRVANLKARKQKAVEKRDERRPSQVMEAFQKRFAVASTASQLALLESQTSHVSSSDVDEELEEAEEEEETESEEVSSSEYETEYQYREPREDSQSEDSNIPPRKRSRLGSTRKRSEMVTTDIFHSSDSSDDSN